MTVQENKEYEEYVDKIKKSFSTILAEMANID